MHVIDVDSCNLTVRIEIKSYRPILASLMYFSLYFCKKHAMLLAPTHQYTLWPLKAMRHNMHKLLATQGAVVSKWLRS